MRRSTILAGVGLVLLIIVSALRPEMTRQAAGTARPLVVAAVKAAAPEQAHNRQTGETHVIMLPALSRNYDPTYVSPFGVVMYGNVDDAAGLAAMQAAGTKTATTILYWAAIQPTQDGALDWSSFDTKAQNAQAAGIDLFVLFTGNPAWAAQYPGGPVTDTQHLVNFVTAMVQRYNCDGIDDAPGHPCVRYWSFYAEPDNGDPGRAQYGGKGYWGDNGAGYAAMLEQISPAIHAVDPKAKVLIGGLAYDGFTTYGGPFVRSFLGATLARLNADHPGEVGKYLDAVAFHYYPISTALWPTIIQKAQEIRGIMAANGAGNLPLLSPEMGYWSSEKMGSSEAGQANWLVQTYVRGLSIDLRLLSWFKVFDDVVAGSPADIAKDQTAGLFRVDSTAKPAYFAYKTLAHELAFARYVGPFQAAGVEGYVFRTDVNQQKTVLWGKTGTVRVTFPYTHLRVVTATGAEYDILDNQHSGTAPGDVDNGVSGQIALEVPAGQPLFVERK